jgi:hypothetical protein|tara:strand:- start:7359 stop:7814 length:456 start_codon:yes stop_codon:yes gene_type:complete
MNIFDEFGLAFSDMIGPWIAIIVSLSAVFWFKDFTTNLVHGLNFKMNPSFNEGDAVVLNDEDAIIVKIGWRESVFGVYSKKGYTWRYVQNDRLHLLKLEKIVNKNLHLDTDVEKGKRMQALLDLAQSDQINANKIEIDKIITQLETQSEKD